MQACQIVALEKNWEKPIEGSSWNNAIMKWVLLVKTDGYPKTYEILLQMTYLSSRRVVKVNGVEKHTAMTTFGYQSKFNICEGVDAIIKQIGLNFEYELFVNGHSFNLLEEKRPIYAPPNIELNNIPGSSFLQLQENKYKANFSKNDYLIPYNPINIQVKNVTLQQPKTSSKIDENKFCKIKQETEEERIKRTQKQLLLILKQKKKGQNKA